MHTGQGGVQISDLCLWSQSPILVHVTTFASVNAQTERKGDSHFPFIPFRKLDEARKPRRRGSC